MTYFKSPTPPDPNYESKWQAVVTQIRAWPFPSSIKADISQPLEAKALYVFSIARRFMRAAYAVRSANPGWKPIFLEATALLYPMIELVGYARLDPQEVATRPGRRSNSADVPSINLWAGLHWLADYTFVPKVDNNDQGSDPTIFADRTIGQLITLRHFLLHGSKQARDRSGKPTDIETILNYRLPESIISAALVSMPAYWRQLKADHGTTSPYWLERLAQADIRPLVIQGSGYFEAGLVDPDIVECLEGRGNVLT